MSLASRILGRLGHRVTGFTSAVEAVRTFRGHPGNFDLVITDLNMPGTSGLNIAADLLRVRPEMPVVLCSGSITPELRERARAVGIREFLHKPNTREEYVAILDRLAPAPRQP